MRSISVTGIVFAASLAAAASPAAAVLLSPVAATVDVPSYWDISHVIDKSGLDPAFVDGQDFDSYVASGPLASPLSGAGLWAAAEPRPGAPAYRGAVVDLDLGQAYTIDAMAFWNSQPEDPGAVNLFGVYISSDPTFSTAVSVGTFEATNGPPTFFDLSLVQVFDLPATIGRYVRLELRNIYGDTSTSIAFNEVAFDVSPVPEPGTLLVMAGGLAFLACRARRSARTSA
jgi:hypothetical protein